MENKLENLCEERGIMVEFITNKFIDTESGIKCNKPVIKVHKIFKECPMRVATAVVEIFTGEGYISECLEIIEKYLTQKFGPVGIKIQPPEVIKIRPANKDASTIYNMNEVNYNIQDEMHERMKGNYYNKAEIYKVNNENYYDMEEMYIEADISSIDVTNKRGRQKRLNDNEILMPEEQDILELNIVVEPSLHK